ncbi:hypothetical protein BLOT_004488 [Blomia tropicalis]|nr:hypothetical protein BLOT_004488 [Blomia tropicalis]
MANDSANLWCRPLILIDLIVARQHRVDGTICCQHLIVTDGNVTSQPTANSNLDVMSSAIDEELPRQPYHNTSFPSYTNGQRFDQGWSIMGQFYGSFLSKSLL